MKERIVFFIAVFLGIQSGILAQNSLITGKVTDRRTKDALSFATVRVVGSTKGTTTNSLGDFELRLKPGTYHLVASFMGYQSDTQTVVLSDKKTGLTFSLTPSSVALPAVTIKPGENPAIHIIKQAIARKHLRNEKLQAYIFQAYTKLSFKTSEKVVTGNSSGVGILYDGPDTAKQKIAGIFENQSTGYRKGTKSKDIIIARKQTANIPSYVNTLTGGRLVQDFYADEVNLFAGTVPGPLSNNSFKYYYFRITDTVAIDNHSVYKISMTPDDTLDAGLMGYIYITADTYDLAKVAVGVNKAADASGFLDSLLVVQSFFPYGVDNIYMPVDYHMGARLNLMGLLKVGFDLNTVLFDYNVNPEISDDLFTKAVITVNTDADSKDSTHWAAMQKISATEEETVAYHQLDSIAHQKKTAWERFSGLSSRWNLNDNFSVSSLLGMYHFNRVEGHSVDFSFAGYNLLDDRAHFNTGYSYGFADQKWKGNFDAKYMLGDYRTAYVKGSIFRSIRPLMSDATLLGDLTNTILVLLRKYEDNTFYYSDGFHVKTQAEVFPVLALSLAYSSTTDRSAKKNTDVSILKPHEAYNANGGINDLRINEVTLGFTFDTRDYLEDGKYRRRLGDESITCIVNGAFHFADKSFGSEINTKRADLQISGAVQSLGSTSFDYELSGSYAFTGLPIQSMTALTGNIQSLYSGMTFRTLDFNEIYGDRTAQLHIQYYFENELFRLSNISFLKASNLRLTGFLNAGLSSVSSDTRNISPRISAEFLHPFYEAGFGISHPKIPISLEFAWKLNYRGNNDYTIGLATSLH
ncbi:MAG: DUF5686 and carboxypeptidase regulatory-like domain-containing protein [Ignavibacteria bacterium]|nr:DUF5686 and carboxypeptidase regulatory-like domain-containing protein [Ignavibacteria bacterium]